jgi:hypothetical protein
MYDFRFQQKIDTLKIGIMDPFYRQKIRNQNRHFDIYQKKYESSEFSLKNLIKICLQNYFPNVGWRWIGAGHHAHVWTLIIITMTLELGLWEAWEIRDLLRTIYNTADCLNKLEGFVCTDVNAGRVKGAFLIDAFAQLALAREHIACILLQCVTVVNDYAFLVSIPFVDYGLGVFNKDTSHEEEELPGVPGKQKKSKREDLKGNDLLKHLFFRKNDIYHFFSDIIISYIVGPRDDRLVTKDMPQITIMLFMYIAGVDSDPFYSSLETVTQDALEFYIDPSENLKKISKDSTVICHEICEILDGIAHGKFDIGNFSNDKG